jgi:hypothetical protein
MSKHHVATSEQDYTADEVAYLKECEVYRREHNRPFVSLVEARRIVMEMYEKHKDLPPDHPYHVPRIRENVKKMVAPD